MRRFTFLAVLSAILAPPLAAQRVVLDNNTRPIGAGSRKTVVRTPGGELYSLSVKPNGALLLLRSKDGLTWTDTKITINDTTSGIGSTNPTTACGLAVDARGWLHAVWGRYRYPTFFKTYYRNLDPNNPKQGSAILDLTAMAGAGTRDRTDAVSVAVDAKGYVWLGIVAPRRSWVTDLWVSQQPLAPGARPKFTNVGTMSLTYSSQRPMIAIDSNGLVHCVFYFNRPPGLYAHRTYDPATKKWGPMTVIGTPAVSHDDAGVVDTDRTGGVHVLYDHEPSAATRAIAYRSWTAAGGWSKPIEVARYTTTQIGGSQYRFTFALAVNPVTREVWVVYRDFARGGRLVAAHKRAQDTAFSYLTELEPASTAKNVYYLPNTRGSLHPFPANSTLCLLDVVYRFGSSAPYSLVFQRLDVCSTSIFGQGCAGTKGTPALGHIELPRLQRPLEVALQNARPNAAAVFTFGLSNSQWGSFKLPFDLALIGAPGCKILASPDVLMPVATDASGKASVRMQIPNNPWLLGKTVFDQAFVHDRGANRADIVATNGGRFTIRR